MRPSNKLVAMVGVLFGRLTVISICADKPRHLRCLCSCGNYVSVSYSSLSMKRAKSCGCWRRERMGNYSRTHGKSYDGIYKVWSSMIGRCNCKTHSAYRYYGGRGISVCKRWMKSIESFLADMGTKPTARHSIDRIDNNGNYEPKNCRWATKSEQNRNRSGNRIIEFSGRSMTLKDWSEELGISYAALRGRLNRGWPVEIALSKPVATKRAMN